MPEAAYRILVVEDHGALGRFIAIALRSGGWEVVGPVADYAAALEAARHCRIDLALMDLMLAGKDCFPIAATLMGRGVRCLLMSGYPHSTLPEPISKLPFVAKPFTLEALVEAVRGVLDAPG